MFTLTGSGIRNILFNTRLRNPAQLPTQLTFCPAQFASKKAHNFHFFSRTLSEGLYRGQPLAVHTLDPFTGESLWQSTSRTPFPKILFPPQQYAPLVEVVKVKTQVAQIVK